MMRGESNRAIIQLGPTNMSCRRFEEIVDEEPPKDKENSKKRPRESDAMDIEEPSKSQKKKQKKQKGADGEATAVASQAEPPAEKTKKDKKDKKDKSEKAEKAKPDTKVLQGGVQVVDHKIGTGPKAKAGDLVSMRYVGKLQNGKVFDQNTKGNAVSGAKRSTADQMTDHPLVPVPFGQG